MGADRTPLCVDLDGTLIAGDTLVLSLRQIASRAPWRLPGIALALLHGRAAFKRAVANTLVLDPAKLPWRGTVVAFVREQHSDGRRVLLTTAADRRIAESVAAHLGCFDGIVASDGAENAKGATKVEAIRRVIGRDAPFDYIGDSAADLPIFAAARIGYLVAPTPALRKQAVDTGRIGRIFDEVQGVQRLSRAMPAAKPDLRMENMPDSTSPPSTLPSRESTLALMQEYTQSESLRKHMLGVEGIMRAYAEKFGEDVERWGLCGLIHDFDYERWPNAEHSAEREHPAEGVRILRSLGYPEDVLQSILGHATYCNVTRETLMAKTLFAVDELSGLVTATALVRPSRSVLEVDARSVRKKMKDKAFARGVSREDVLQGASELGIDLDEHIQFVVDAMKARADLLGLAGMPTST